MKTKERNLHSLLEIGIVPIVRADSPEKALRAAQAICRGGLRALEVTMTVPKAIHVIEKVSDEFGGEMLIGAGSVLDTETARACMLAGAEFFVTPSLNPKTIEICHRYGKIIMPGALTPTEVLTAWEAGADLVKIFPCGNVGGPKYIKALKAPLPQVPMVPTGGVSIDNTVEFFKAGASAVAVGSELCDKQAMADGRYEVIEENAKQFLDAVRKARGK
jgi:2-dehydro-3-deoxyphosphogluconate aldolase/(4S)-4-hydroxy-2-oxoglutarate aldolase